MKADFTVAQGLQLFKIGLTQRTDEYYLKFLIGRTPRRGDRKIRISYKDFFKWTKRHGSDPFCSERTIYRVIERLEKAGAIIVHMKGFGEVLLEVNIFVDKILHSQPGLTEVSNDQKSGDVDPEPNRGENPPEARIKQQQLIEIKQLCTKVGIKYRLEKDWYEILSHGVQKVKETIEVFKHRRLTSCIQNPLGWFRTALRRNYRYDYDPQDEGLKTMNSLVDRFIDIKQQLFEVHDLVFDPKNGSFAFIDKHFKPYIDPIYPDPGENIRPKKEWGDPTI